MLNQEESNSGTEGRKHDEWRFIETKKKFNNTIGYIESIIGKCALQQYVLEKYCGKDSFSYLHIDRAKQCPSMEYVENELGDDLILRKGWEKAKDDFKKGNLELDPFKLAIYLYTMSDYEVDTGKDGIKKVYFYQEFNKETSDFAGRKDSQYEKYPYKYYLFLLLAGKNYIFHTREPSISWRTKMFYRGCTFLKDVKEGQYICFNHVVSTTSGVNVALNFLPKENSALFQFIVDVQHDDFPASVKDFSQFSGEDEYLFYPDAKFKVTQIIGKKDQMFIYLECVNDDFRNEWKAEWKFVMANKTIVDISLDVDTVLGDALKRVMKDNQIQCGLDDVQVFLPTKITPETQEQESDNESSSSISSSSQTTTEEPRRFGKSFGECVSVIWGYKQLLNELEALRTTSYDAQNADHEHKLQDLWNLLMPNRQLDSRVSNLWKELGFQGDDPKTDFRGMGLLGLENLLYSFAIVGINLTHLAFNLWRDGAARNHVYNLCYHQSPSSPCRPKPANIMEFSRIRGLFEKRVRSLLADPHCIFKLNFLVEDL
nr:EOG090X0AMT [Ilyocryptus agilis]